MFNDLYLVSINKWSHIVYRHKHQKGTIFNFYNNSPDTNCLVEVAQYIPHSVGSLGHLGRVHFPASLAVALWGLTGFYPVKCRRSDVRHLQFVS